MATSLPDARRGRRRLRALLLGLIALLYVVSVPWYRADDAAPGQWLGLPSWVAVAIACYFAIACLNAWAWLLTEVSDDVEGSQRREVAAADREGSAS